MSDQRSENGLQARPSCVQPNGAKAHNVKLVLLGEQAVGKSSIALRFVRGYFKENSEPTIGAAFLTQTVNVSGVSIKLEIWDTAGQERFHSLAPMYYRGAPAAAVVYDITNTRSFQKAKQWIKELKEHVNSQIIIVLVGNKADMAADQRAVPREEAQSFAEENNLMFTESSAKTGMGVGDIFMAVAQTFANHRPAPESEAKGIKLAKGAEKKREICC